MYIIKFMNNNFKKYIEFLFKNNQNNYLLGRWCHINIPNCDQNIIFKKIDFANNDNNLCYKRSDK